MIKDVYDNSAVRRQDRLLDAARAEELLRNAGYGTLSMVGEDGLPYGIPLNFVWDGERALYVHCATEGHKLRAIAKCADISFCIVGNVVPQPKRLTTLYESVIIRGKAHTGLPDEARRHALRLLVRKFAPDQADSSETAIARSFHRTEIIRIDIDSISGKAKIPPK